MHSQQTIDILTMFSSTNTGMDLSYINISDNYDKIRSRTSSPKPQSSRTSSISSTKFLVAYHERMENNNSLDKDFNMGMTTLNYLMQLIRSRQIMSVQWLT